MELRLKANAWKRKHGLDVIIVDYLGLMTGGDGDKRHEQIGSHSGGLKALARELGGMIALAQLNRNVENRPDRRPMLFDLRDSGEIAQDADIVMLVHRQEMYEPILRVEWRDAGRINKQTEQHTLEWLISSLWRQRNPGRSAPHSGAHPANRRSEDC